MNTNLFINFFLSIEINKTNKNPLKKKFYHDNI